MHTLIRRLAADIELRERLLTELTGTDLSDWISSEGSELDDLIQLHPADFLAHDNSLAAEKLKHLCEKWEASTAHGVLKLSGELKAHPGITIILHQVKRIS